MTEATRALLAQCAEEAEGKVQEKVRTGWVSRRICVGACM